MQGMAINPTGTRFSQSSGLQNKHVETFLVDGIRRPMGTQPPRRQINKSTVHTVLQRLHADPILRPAQTDCARRVSNGPEVLYVPMSHRHSPMACMSPEMQRPKQSIEVYVDVAGAEDQPGFLSTTSRWQILGTQSRDDQGVLYSGGECLQSSILRTPSRIVARVVAHVIDLLCARIWI